MRVPSWLSQFLFLGAAFYLLVWRVVLRHVWHDRVPRLVTKAHVLQVVFGLLTATAGGLIAHLIYRHSIGGSTNPLLFLVAFALFALGCLAGIAALDAGRDNREAQQTEFVMEHTHDGPGDHAMDVI